MSFTLTILGSGSATPTKLRNPSGQLLNIQQRHVLIDCAEGSQSTLKKLSISFNKIHHIYISHLHGDHFFGLPGLISSMHLHGRKELLHIYGPVGIKYILEQILLISHTELQFPIAYRELDCEERSILFEDNTFVVKCFPLIHRVPCWGYVFQEKEKELNIDKDVIEKYDLTFDQIHQIKKGEDLHLPGGKILKNKDITTKNFFPKSYAYCSDTLYTESIIEDIRRVNTLYHEATFADDFQEVAKEKFHSTARQAALIAKQAEAERLLIGHFSARYKETEVLINEAREVFPNTETIEDFQKFIINPK